MLLTDAFKEPDTLAKLSCKRTSARITSHVQKNTHVPESSGERFLGARGFARDSGATCIKLSVWVVAHRRLGDHEKAGCSSLSGERVWRDASDEVAHTMTGGATCRHGRRPSCTCHNMSGE